MVTECVAILAISLCLVVVFIRAGHGDYAASVTPILVVPFVHLLALPVSWWTDSLFPALAPQSVVAFADIAAVVVSCLMIMSFSGKIRNRKNKKQKPGPFGAGFFVFFRGLGPMKTGKTIPPRGGLPPVPAGRSQPG